MSPKNSSIVELSPPEADQAHQDTTKIFAWLQPSNQPSKAAFHSVMESLISLDGAGAHCRSFMHATQEIPRAASVDSMDEDSAEAKAEPKRTCVGKYGLELTNASLENSGWTIGAGCLERRERKVDLLLVTDKEQKQAGAAERVFSRHVLLQFHPHFHQLGLMAYHTVSFSGRGGHKEFKGLYHIIRDEDVIQLGLCTYKIEFTAYGNSAAYKEELRMFMATRIAGSTKLHLGLLAASYRQMETLGEYTFAAGAFANGGFGDVSAGINDKGDLVAVKRLRNADKEKTEGHKALMEKLGFHVGNPFDCTLIEADLEQKNVLQFIHVFEGPEISNPVTFCFYQPLCQGSLAGM
ncbi:MAG: hypothetical protein Q9221_008045 [Calogaya cf. arnoldii]